MNFGGRNSAILNHSVNGKSLLLFKQIRGGLIFEDEMIYESYHIERAPDSNGVERDAIVFELRPLSAVVERVEAEAAPEIPIAA